MFTDSRIISSPFSIRTKNQLFRSHELMRRHHLCHLRHVFYLFHRRDTLISVLSARKFTQTEWMAMPTEPGVGSISENITSQCSNKLEINSTQTSLLYFRMESHIAGTDRVNSCTRMRNSVNCCRSASKLPNSNRNYFPIEEEQQ